MSFYLLVVIVGLLLKSITAARFYTHFPKEYVYLKMELSIFFVVFIASSIVNLFIFAPIEWTRTLGVSIDLICRLYYLVDNVSTLVGALLLFGMFRAQLHKSPAVIILVLVYIFGGGYSVLFTDTHIQGIEISQYMVLAKQVPNDPYIIIFQLVAFIPLLGVIAALVRTYRNAKTNQNQIHNFYALIAFILFDISYISSLWFGLDRPMEMVMSTRGFLFFFVITVTLLSRDVFDIRHFTPKTSENLASIKLRRLFQHYSNEKIGHKEAVHEIEKAMVEYKITKSISFKDGQGSALPVAAQSMKISRSGLYDVLKRLGITPPGSK